MTLCQFDGWKRVKTVATNDCQGRRKLRKVGGGGGQALRGTFRNRRALRFKFSNNIDSSFQKGI